MGPERVSNPGMHSTSVREDGELGTACAAPATVEAEAGGQPEPQGSTLGNTVRVISEGGVLRPPLSWKKGH